MATPELAIAKASFSALLFRKEPVSLTRPEIETFYTLLHDTIYQCSPANVQKCKYWILNNLASSPARVAALGKYLAALSKSFTSDDSSAKKTKPSSKRKRLHTLYIINDVLHHVVIRDRDARIATELQPSLRSLFHSAASFRNCPKHARKLDDLLGLWDKQRYFSGDKIEELRETINKAPHGSKASKAADDQDAHDQTGPNVTVKPAKDAPYMIPSIHGDPNTPWFDLPAANWLPHLEPNSTKPMNPNMIKPLQLAPGPADKALAKAVKDLLTDVERLYSKSSIPQQTDQPPTDLTEMGERVVLDEITGEVIDGKTYYGWSSSFCEKMKQRKKGKAGDGRGCGRSISRSSSRSFSPGRSSRSDSPPAFKRRRLSPDSRSLSRSRSRDRRRSPQRGSRYDSRDYSRSRSRSRSRSLSASRSHNRYRSRSQSTDRGGHRDRGDSSTSPVPHHGRSRYDSDLGQGYNQPPPPPLPPPNNHTPPAFPPYPPPLPNTVGAFGHFSTPPPPPPPQGYQGTWPPPPPPIGYMGGPLQNWGVPPPPPTIGGWNPPLQSHNQYQQYGRGNGGYRSRGRGFERGRGNW